MFLQLWFMILKYGFKEIVFATIGNVFALYFFIFSLCTYSKFSLFSLQEGRVSDILETGSAGSFIGNVLSQAVPWLLGFDIKFTIYK